ncbi:MAG TPA: NnrU family protein [Burkholderiaceae bacterium]|nr:NnrU family protein [Burkholderiaceae bacterium]
MAILVFGLIVFLGIHSVQIVRPGLRERIIQKAGSVSAWKLTFSGLATIGLLLVILGYSLARYQTPVWYQPPAGLRHLALLVMLPVFPLLFATYLKGRISQLVGHPMLAATALWAIAHLLANGSMADVLLFGSFLVWALADWWSVRRRGEKRQPGRPEHWRRNDAVAVVAGVAVYGVFIAGLHRWLFGVSPV